MLLAEMGVVLYCLSDTIWNNVQILYFSSVNDSVWAGMGSRISSFGNTIDLRCSQGVHPNKLPFTLGKILPLFPTCAATGTLACNRWFWVWSFYLFIHYSTFSVSVKMNVKINKVGHLKCVPTAIEHMFVEKKTSNIWKNVCLVQILCHNILTSNPPIGSNCGIQYQLIHGPSKIYADH